MRNRILLSGIVLLGIVFGFDLVARFGVENLWFQEVGYPSVFWLGLITKTIVGSIVTLGSLLLLLKNLRVARQSSSLTGSDHVDYPLAILLPLSIGLSVSIALLLLQSGLAVASAWQIDWTQPSVSPSFPHPFYPTAIWQSGNQIYQAGLATAGSLFVAGIAVAILIRPRFLLVCGAIVLSIMLGFVLSQYWSTILQFFHATKFGRIDPLFDRDISFYVFTLPNLELLEFWLVGLCFYAFVAVYLTYLLADNSLSEGRFFGFTIEQQRHLFGLGACLMSVIAASFWLSRYELLYSTRGVAYGASYTDVQVQLPVNTALAIGAAAIALYCFWKSISRSKKSIPLIKSFIIYGIVATIASLALPNSVQRLSVQPNELTRERPFIERSIERTREAFNLTVIDAEQFDPQNTLTFADLQRNALTVRNIRLWDTRPLLQTNRQLQQIRPYYSFFDADIDRYTLQNGSSQQAEKQQVLIAARELDFNNVPIEAKTWLNEHLIYTHGYGFTMSPVNQVAPGGLPDYFVKDITDETQNQVNSALNLSSAAIRNSIPTENPRIYYGELANTYVMTGTKVKEFDYPSGNESVYNTYNGRGGIEIAATWRRIMFAKYLNDWQMLFTRNFTDQTKILIRRNINQRIRSIAPFLRYDSDPYLVVADAGEPNSLYWIVDAYTTSDRYPYSDPGQANYNYIRNSVKVVIDAYNGSTNFYIADPEDPIIQTWTAIFPALFKPLSAMPRSLFSHLRYPIDLFNRQSNQLIRYHMTDPQVFYNREDQWQVPTEIYGNQPQPVEPYYLITKLPTAPSEEFILLLPFTPNQRTNLIAWLAARSDGQNYGKLLLYTFPKQELVFGTAQIEARINQDPVISQQITLWNRAGSRVIQGNLLVIPIEQSLLYVEPIYLEAEQNSLPTLVRVVVAYENRITMAETLDQALRAVFQPTRSTPAIVRPVAGDR